VAAFARTGQDPLALAARARDAALTQRLRLRAQAAHSVEHRYADPVRESEHAQSPFRSSQPWKKALLASAGADPVDAVRLGATLSEALPSLGRPGLGSLAAAFDQGDAQDRAARVLHADAARPAGVSRFDPNSLHGQGNNARTPVGSDGKVLDYPRVNPLVPGMSLNAR
jgi:hypothetical protein